MLAARQSPGCWLAALPHLCIGGSNCYLAITLLFGVVNMSQINAIVISITLDGQNYPEWVFCVETALRGHGLFFHLTDNAHVLKELVVMLLQ